jgi:tape measure domain-containing protein
MADKQANFIIALKDYVSDKLAKISGNVDKLSANLQKSGLLFGAVAAGIGLVGSAALIASGKMEQWRISFTTMLGSAEQADVLLNKIKDFASKTPFELPQVVEGSKRLLAYGISARSIIPTMEALGNIAAGVGTEKLPQLITAFGQVSAKGKLMGQELLQFTEAGVNLGGELQKAFGVTRSELEKMISTGKVGFRDVENALTGLGTGSGKFAGLMESQSKSFFGIISNIKDNVFQVSEAFGNMLLPTAKKLANTIKDFSDYIRETSPTVKLAILAIGGLTMAFTGLIAGAAGLLAIWPALAAAWAIATGPIGLAALAITAVTGSLVALTVAANNARAGIDELSTSTMNRSQKVMHAMDEQIAKQKRLIDSFIRDGREESETYKVIVADYEKMLKAKARLATEHASELKKIKEEEEKPAGDAPTEDAGLVKLKADAVSKIEVYRFTAEEIAKKRDEEMAAELIKKGEHNLAKDLLDSAQKNREDIARKKKIELDEKANELRAANLKSTLGTIASMSSNHNKTLAFAGKAAAIAMATIDTFSGVGKAWALGPILGPPLAALVAVAGMANVANISGVKLAEGGMLMPRSGGVSAVMAEAGKAEVAIPLDDERTKEKLRDTLGGGGNTIVIQAGTIVADDYSVGEFAKKIDEKLFELQRNGRSYR